MESQRPSYVSVLDPVSPAIDRAKFILFRPFDLTKWFVIGFCAFLANLGSGGGGGSGGGRGGSPPGGGAPDFGQVLNHAKEYVLVNLSWIAPVAIVVVVLIITIMLALAWLSSRGRFMFLHCVAQNKAEVAIPWAQFREHAYSLFLFRIVLGLIGIFVILIPGIITAILVITSIINHKFAAGAILGVIFLGLIIFTISILVAMVSKFTTDFVVPIMFIRTTSVRAAWNEFLSVLSINKARFFIYFLFNILLSMGIGILLLGIVIITCCCACCFFAIPYIGTVVTLPIHIFKRSYSLYYLRQYGQQFDVFVNDSENHPQHFSENPV